MLTLDYTFGTETGYIGSGTIVVRLDSTEQDQRIVAFADARLLGFHNVQWVNVDG